MQSSHVDTLPSPQYQVASCHWVFRRRLWNKLRPNVAAKGLILLTDSTTNALPVSISYIKSPYIARSILGLDIVAISDMFYEAFAVRQKLQQIRGLLAPLHLMTDSKCLYDVLSKNTRISKRRLMIDVASAREANQARAVDNIGFVWSGFDLTDSLNKSHKQAALHELLATARHEPTTAQWIIRAQTYDRSHK